MYRNMMYHIFLTRLAIDYRNIKQYRKFSYEHVAEIVNFWHRFGSKFYNIQTIERPFEVRLLYGYYYKDIVLSYQYPKWAKLCLQENDIFPKFGSMTSHRPLAIHRVDADDQYSIDFFERFESQFINYSGVVLHRKVLQYNVKNCHTSQILTSNAPHFLSVVIQHYEPVTRKDFQPLTTDHGKVPQVFNCMYSDMLDVLALEAVDRGNVNNKWSNKCPTKELHPRFAYYGRKGCKDCKGCE